MKKTILFFSLILFIIPSFSQEVEPDSLKQLDEVFIRAFEQNRKSRFSTASVKIIEHNNADRYNKNSLVNGFNTIPGVRMEERSPGSYRINIRGSSLRSPFGVRNVKVYWNDIPVTDPGGNTYFNQFAYNNFSSIEVFKGPAGSLYGAGTGGLILIIILIAGNQESVLNTSQAVTTFKICSLLPDLVQKKIATNLLMPVIKVMATGFKQKCAGIIFPGNHN